MKRGFIFWWLVGVFLTALLIIYMGLRNGAFG